MVNRPGNSKPSPVRESPSRLKNNGTSKEVPNFEFEDGYRRGKCSDSTKYWMTDKAGHLCRWTEIEQCNTLQATDYKDPPVILSEKPIMIEMTSTKNTIVEDGISPTITARMGTGGNQVNAVCVKRT